MRRALGVVASVGAAGVLLVGQQTLPAGALEDPVDIRVEHDLIPTDAGPRVLEATGVVVGPGPELTIADEVDNPSEWGGNVLVDIDPEAQTITIEVEDQNCFDIVEIEITSDEITSLFLVSDELWDPEDEDDDPPALATSVAGGVTTITWNTPDTDCPGLNVEGSQAIFRYNAVPEVSLSPVSVNAGDAVTVTGDLCPSGPIMATITADGGTTIVDDEEQTVADAAGDWTFEIDTTGYAPGTYSVATRCVQADLQGFDYEVLTFTVVAPTPTTTPAPGPQPVVATPRYTG